MAAARRMQPVDCQRENIRARHRLLGAHAIAYWLCRLRTQVRAENHYGSLSPEGVVARAGRRNARRTVLPRAFDRGVVEVVLVDAHAAYASMRQPRIDDAPPGIGPTAGVLALLAHATRSGVSYAIAIACDIPSSRRPCSYACALPALLFRGNHRRASCGDRPILAAAMAR
jgi:hypothetical protein